MQKSTRNEEKRSTGRPPVAVANSDVIVIESNHDPDMLEQSSRPLCLKKRIRERGHLSNRQRDDIIARAIHHSTFLPQSIILAHISQECNTNAIAINSASETLQRMGAFGINLFETLPFHSNSEVLC